MTSPSYSYYDIRPKTRRNRCLKCVTFFLTTILLVLGTSIFGTFGLIKLRYSHPAINVPDACVVGFASLVTIAALLGYASTCCTRSVLVKLLIASLVLVTCVVVFLDVVVFTQPQLTHDVVERLWTLLNDHGRVQFQKLLHCCDVTTVRGNATAAGRWASSYHSSCFEEQNAGDEVFGSGDWGGVTGNSPQRRLGCFDVIIGLINENLYLISGVIGGLVVVNVLLVLASCAQLMSYSRNDDNEAKRGRRYSSFPVVTDVILWKRRGTAKKHFKQNVRGIFELPPTYPTEPILQAYKNSIEKSMKGSM